MQIQGFTPEQHEIATQLWQMTDWQSVAEYVGSLTPEQQRSAQVVVYMILAHELDNYMEVSDAVRDYLGCR